MATNRSGTGSSQGDDAVDNTDGRADGNPPIRIKKYANRRLYNTASSSYVTLEHLSQMVKDGQDFVVTDARTGDDITRSVLTQIIVEEESKGGQNMLPIRFLRQLISLYGDNMQWMVPKYLEHSLESFAENQEKMRKYMQNTVTGIFPFNSIDDVSRQNMAMVENAMKMFNPLNAAPPQPGSTQSGQSGSHRTEQGRDERSSPKSGGAAEDAASRPDDDDPMTEMQRRLDELQRQMEALGQIGRAMADHSRSGTADDDGHSGDAPAKSAGANKTDAGKTDSGKTDSGKSDSSKTDSSRTGPGKSGGNRSRAK